MAHYAINEAKKAMEIASKQARSLPQSISQVKKPQISQKKDKNVDNIVYNVNVTGSS